MGFTFRQLEVSTTHPCESLADGFREVLGRDLRRVQRRAQNVPRLFFHRASVVGRPNTQPRLGLFVELTNGYCSHAINASIDSTESKASDLQRLPPVRPRNCPGDVPQHGAGFPDFGHGDTAIKLLTFALSRNHARRAQNRQMLRQVCLRYSQAHLQLGRPALLPPEKFDQLQPGRIRKRLADRSLALIRCHFRRSRAFSSCPQIAQTKPSPRRHRFRPTLHFVLFLRCVIAQEGRERSN